MKRSLPLLLATLLLVFSLTACGRDNNQGNGANDNAPAADNGTTENGNGGANGAPGDNAADDGNVNNGSVTDDVGNAIEDTGDAIRDGVNDVGDALTGEPNTGVRSGINGTVRNNSGTLQNGAY